MIIRDLEAFKAGKPANHHHRLQACLAKQQIKQASL